MLLGCIGDVVDRLVVEEDLVVTLLSQIHKLPGYTYSVHIVWNSLVYNYTVRPSNKGHFGTNINYAVLFLCREVVLF